MTDSYDAQIFQHYELIPRNQTLRPPLPDTNAEFKSKPYQRQQNNNVKENGVSTESQQLIKELNKKQKIIIGLKNQIQQLNGRLELKNAEFTEYIKLFQNIKEAVGNPNIKIQEIAQEIKVVLQKQKENIAPSLDQNVISNANKIKSLQTLLLQKQGEIRSLKAQLFESTANNINALFNIELSPEQCVLKQIDVVKKEINKLNSSDIMKQNTCRHQQKLLNLIKNYEEMLNLYHKNENQVHELKARQQEYFAYFSTAKAEISESITNACSKYTERRLSEFENKIKNMSQSTNNLPERVKPDEQSDFRVRELINQIQNLNQRVIQREIQAQKLRQTNQQLMTKIRQCESQEIQLEQIGKLQIKLKQKDKRIQQLENTIIDHIDSRAKEDSNTSMDSSDVQRQKNTVRNLKVVVTNLKEENSNIKAKLKEIAEENKQLKRKLSNLPQDEDKFDVVQKVCKDGGSLKVVEEILEILVSSAELEGKCRCLQRTADCLISLNQQHPELQRILQQMGVIQKTSNLLPVNMADQ